MSAAEQKQSRTGNFLYLLVVLVVLFVLQPVVANTGRLAASLLNLLFVSAVAAATASTTGRRLLRFGVYTLGAVAFVCSWLGVVWQSTAIVLIVYGSYLLFFAVVCANVMAHVLRGGDVTANKLYAVCCVYLLAGIAWAFLFALTEAIAPGSFELPPTTSQQTPLNPLIYFSMATLTTLGYGDITPLSGFARSVASLEALFGQAYLAVLVARLVGLRASKTDAAQ